MDNITIKMLAKELNLSTAAISKALRDSHEISTPTKQRVQELASRLNYIPNAYAGSLRRRKSKTIAVVLPEVADSFFSLAINGIEAIAEEKGYHVLIYLTHESLSREQAILKDFQSGRVDGVLMSLTAETANYQHISELHDRDIPLVFFDRVCEEVDTAKITTNDFESSYKATQHLIECGCKRIALLSISNCLSISNKRFEGYEQALKDHHVAYEPINILCENDAVANYTFMQKIMSAPDRPDGVIATVEKLTTDIYLACKELKLTIPNDVKIVSFSNLSSASILSPSLTTVTQPAFEMGKAAAVILFKSLEKKNFTLHDESLIIPSELIIRGSTVLNA
ncbi:MAG: LacI family DNA-binding transcriptional regulator [Bacteroidota bacterium]